MSVFIFWLPPLEQQACREGGGTNKNTEKHKDSLVSRLLCPWEMSDQEVVAVSSSDWPEPVPMEPAKPKEEPLICVFSSSQFWPWVRKFLTESLNTISAFCEAKRDSKKYLFFRNPDENEQKEM